MSNKDYYGTPVEKPGPVYQGHGQQQYGQYYSGQPQYPGQPQHPGQPQYSGQPQYYAQPQPQPQPQMIYVQQPPRNDDSGCGPCACLLGMCAGMCFCCPCCLCC